MTLIQPFVVIGGVIGQIAGVGENIVCKYITAGKIMNLTKNIIPETVNSGILFIIIKDTMYYENYKNLYLSIT